jgi:FkbM family methyltransferase
MTGAWLAHVLLSSRGHVSVDGHKMRLSGRRGPSPTFGIDMLLGRYETEVSRYLQQVLKPGMTVLDIGAHVGFYTLAAARMVGPEGMVYAFEPEPENFAVLQENVKANGYGNVRLVNKAVTNQRGKVEFYVSAQGNDRHSIFRSGRPSRMESRIVVEATSIDEFLEAESWPRVDFVKMDIEGAEPGAIAGMHKLLARCQTLTLVMEFAPELLQAAGTNGQKLLADLSSLGFSLAVIEDDGTCYRFDNTNFCEVAKDAQQRGAVNLLCRLHATAAATAGSSSTDLACGVGEVLR